MALPSLSFACTIVFRHSRPLKFDLVWWFQDWTKREKKRAAAGPWQCRCQVSETNFESFFMHKDGHSTHVSITFTGCNPVRHSTVHCTGKMGSCIRMPHSCLQKIFPIWSIMCHPGSAKKSEWDRMSDSQDDHDIGLPDWQAFRTYSNISIPVTSSIHHHSMHISVSRSGLLKNPGFTFTLGQSHPWPTEDLSDSGSARNRPANVHNACSSHVYHGHTSNVYHRFHYIYIYLVYVLSVLSNIQ